MTINEIPRFLYECLKKGRTHERNDLGNLEKKMVS